MSDYVFDKNKDDEELERLKKIESVCDQKTLNFLKEINPLNGKACLEIGPGGGSILKWLLSQVGIQGSVTAIDINPRFIKTFKEPQLEIIQADINDVQLNKKFDLIHIRYVLVHQSTYLNLIKKIIDWLNPGGYLFIEEPDFYVSRFVDGPEKYRETTNKIFSQTVSYYRSLKYEPALGSHLSRILKGFGLEEIQYESENHLAGGGQPMALLMGESMKHIKDQMISLGHLDHVDYFLYDEMTQDCASLSIYYATGRCLSQKVK